MAERLPTYFLLLQQVELFALHAKVAVIIQQGLCPRVRVITSHDDHLKLHWLSTLCRSLVLQCQDAFNIYLHHRPMQFSKGSTLRFSAPRSIVHNAAL